MAIQTNKKDVTCPLRHAMGIIGGKWKLPIICLLAEGKPIRYNTIKKKVMGITNVMLSQSLKELEAHGVIDRKQYNEIPPRVEYSIAQAGQRLLPALGLLAEWGAEHLADEEAASAVCRSCKAELPAG